VKFSSDNMFESLRECDNLEIAGLRKNKHN
jgi:hypothetical protein